MKKSIVIGGVTALASLSVMSDVVYFKPNENVDLSTVTDWCVYQNTLYSPGSEVEMAGQRKVCIIEDFYHSENRRLTWVDKQAHEEEPVAELDIKIKRVEK